MKEREREFLYSDCTLHVNRQQNRVPFPSSKVNNQNRVTAVNKTREQSKVRVKKVIYNFSRSRTFGKFPNDHGRLFSIFRDRDSSEKRKGAKLETLSNSRFLLYQDQKKKKQIAEYISIYKNIHICMYVCMYIVCTYIHEPTHATRTRRASAFPGAAILPDRYAIATSRNFRTTRTSASGPTRYTGTGPDLGKFLPADRRARELAER